MDIHLHATYRDGLIYPQRPLDLPQNTELSITVTPVNGTDGGVTTETRAKRPTPPRISADDFQARLERYAVRAPSLPADFSRADIYRDHD
jgi:hypothetical protein